MRNASSAARRVDQLGDLRPLLLDLGDDRADRLVDERDPEFFDAGHVRKHRAVFAARARRAGRRRPASARANSRRSACSGSDSAIWTPASTPAIAPSPSTSAARQRTFPYSRWRQTPAAAVGRIASSERRLGVQLRQAEHERQRRHEQDPAADAEQAREHARGQPEHRRQRERPHQTSSQIAMPARSAAKPSESVRACEPLLQAGAEDGADRRRAGRRPPRRRASARRGTRSVTAPTSAISPIAASDVAIAGRSLKWAIRISSGTTTIPPPTPKRALKRPATRPMSEVAHRRILRGVEDRLARLRSEPGRAAVLLDVDGTLAPIVARPELAVVPEETRAEVRRLAGALRAGRVRQRPARRGGGAARRRRGRRLRRRPRARARSRGRAVARGAAAVRRARTGRGSRTRA